MKRQSITIRGPTFSNQASFRYREHLCQEGLENEFKTSHDLLPYQLILSEGFKTSSSRDITSYDDLIAVHLPRSEFNGYIFGQNIRFFR